VTTNAISQTQRVLSCGTVKDGAGLIIAGAMLVIAGGAVCLTAVVAAVPWRETP
jgi:hypothetical protein